MFQQAKPVFPKGKELEKNLLATFRAETGSLRHATLHITAVSFYQVYVNGAFVGFGPARTAKGYARVDILPLNDFDAGEKNEIVIAVVGYNVMSLSTVCQPSFLCAEVRRDGEVIAFTGRDFVGYLPTCKVQKTERYSFQCHFNEVWDFRKETSLTPDDARCELAVMKNPPKMIERRAPYPYYEDILLSRALTVGTLTFDPELPFRPLAHSEPVTPRWGRFEADEIVTQYPFQWIQRQRQTVRESDVTLPLTLCENEYAVFDFSRIETGFPLFKAVAETDADVVLAFSEDHCPAEFSMTRMGAQLVTETLLPAGKPMDVMSFEPYVMRCVIVAVRSGKLRLDSFGIKTCMHDISKIQIPDHIADPVLRSVYRGAVRTFAHNAVDVFMDCPSRERGGWLCDSYFTAKTEYALFKETAVEDAFLENYRLFRNEGGYPDGMIPMCYPSDVMDDKRFIPQWSMWYILEVADYIANRNPKADAEAFRPSIEGLLAFYKRHENEDGLLERLPSWNFVEWSRANDWTQDVSYPTNFLYAQVLESAYRLFGDEEYLRRSREVREVTVRQSFNGRVFLDHAVRDEQNRLIRQDDCSEACQYYAILFGGIDVQNDPQYKEFLRLVTKVFGAVRTEEIPEVVEVNAFIGAYLRLEALLKLGEKDLILRDIKGFFGHMEIETGTLWEYRQKKGSRDHGFASYALVAMMKALEQ